MGVEEEFLLVDPISAATVPSAPEVLGRVAGPLPAGAAAHAELRATQVEFATGVCGDAGGLRAQLRAGRRHLAAAAEAEGVLLVSAGTPVLGGPARRGDRLERFAEIDERYAGMVADYEACGCHVHVGVPDRDTAVAVVDRLRPWLPTLLALSVNSPFARGRDTGYGSWRMVQQSRFPGSGVPPALGDRAGHDAAVARMVDCGVLVDERMTFWLARPSPTLPTVEFRVADAATTVDEAVLFALLARGLVRAALAELGDDRPAPFVDPQVAAAAVWSAARHGLAGPGVDCRRARRVPAERLVAALVEHVRPALAETGDLALVAELLDRVRRHGTGAERQRAAAGAGWVRAVHALARATQA
ncbi:carboxylate-amine ligase [Amycolatopsis arida]|uniref:Putative glutamate--cysteine ligase 2 n=1 Tax=Amycolatopsis arida TaxID=587909 RepID=A0A1I5XG10_9PSEU|nr:glutamate--cysteine ligase [Amycolatopsis arida]TDX97479.1 carboxylate-amine ligase [Amycolatopsis arida]SFQ30854.1 carboxylate-amine ligase [Amycolatopsis arida]